MEVAGEKAQRALGVTSELGQSAGEQRQHLRFSSNWAQQIGSSRADSSCSSSRAQHAGFLPARFVVAAKKACTAECCCS